MSRDGRIDLTWAGDEREFRLANGQVFALQDERKCGIYELHTRFLSGKWLLEDVIEVLRQGLLGAGVESRIAKRLIEEHVVSGRYAEHALVARLILTAALVGSEMEELGKAEGGEEAPKRAGLSPQPPSMETAPSWDSPPSKSIQ